MIKIMFICHGNICRSPMAEFVFRDMVQKRGMPDQFLIASSATSKEEIGNPIHQGTRRKLHSCQIPFQQHVAVQLKQKDYDQYDYLIGMDQYNIGNIKRIVGEDEQNKIYRLLDFSDSSRDIADPWYTGDFDTTYRDIVEGCEAFLDYLQKEKKI